MNSEAVNNEKFQVTVQTLLDGVGGELTADTMQKLTPDEITLLAYSILRDQLLEGGFIQLIQNGYGPFIFLNPFAKAMRLWGLKDFSKWIYDARELYERTRENLECPTETDEEFMALYEQYPEWDEFDDEFIEIEPQVTKMVYEAFVNSGQNA